MNALAAGEGKNIKKKNNSSAFILKIYYYNKQRVYSQY